MKDIDQLYNAFLKASEVSTDTRTMKNGAIFFALKGPHFDGNKFANIALENGADFVVIDDANNVQANEKIILVKNTLVTLQELATHHRKKLNLPIIAITGSNGKTTTKEIIKGILSKKYNVHATEGNLNNQIGVPLTLLQLSKNHEIGVVEMGANHLKEIRKLCLIALPEWGYITNFGKAHLEGFGSEEAVIEGKSELYQHLIQNKGKILVNGDDYNQLALSKNNNRILFGQNDSVDLKIESIDSNSDEIVLRYEDEEFKSTLHGKYNHTNFAAGIAFGLLFKVPLNEIQKAVSSYQSKNNRSQKLSIQNIPFILDAYNANPSSMEVAIKAFSEKKIQNKLVVLGDMLELGSQTQKEHENILNLSLELEIDRIYTIGIRFAQTCIEDDSIQKFESLEEFTKAFEKNKIPFNGVLIKGSRSMRLENLIPFFESL